jgi:hypothetical protein
MHTHTQSQKYIKLIPKNIPNFNDNKNYFLNDAKKVSSFNTKYDFYSIMHYPPFSKSGKRLIRPLKQYMYYDDFMGQRKALSEGDIKRINNMYQCRDIGGTEVERRASRNNYNNNNKNHYNNNNNNHYNNNNNFNHWPRTPMQTQSQAGSHDRWGNYNHDGLNYNNDDYNSEDESDDSADSEEDNRWY